MVRINLIGGRPRKESHVLFNIGWRALGFVLLAAVLFEANALTNWMFNQASDALVFGGIAINIVTILMAFWVVSKLLKRRPVRED